MNEESPVRSASLKKAEEEKLPEADKVKEREDDEAPVRARHSKRYFQSASKPELDQTAASQSAESALVARLVGRGLAEAEQKTRVSQDGGVSRPSGQVPGQSMDPEGPRHEARASKTKEAPEDPTAVDEESAALRRQSVQSDSRREAQAPKPKDPTAADEESAALRRQSVQSGSRREVQAPKPEDPTAADEESAPLRRSSVRSDSRREVQAPKPEDPTAADEESAPLRRQSVQSGSRREVQAPEPKQAPEDPTAVDEESAPLRRSSVRSDSRREVQAPKPEDPTAADEESAPLHRQSVQSDSQEPAKGTLHALDQDSMVKAALVLQRYVRLKNYRWFLLGRRGPSPVQLPPHPGDKRRIPVGIQHGRDPATAWHSCMRSALEAPDQSEEVPPVVDDDLIKQRAATALAYVSEVGRFAAAARAAAVLAVHEVMLHPYGMDTEKHRRHHLPEEEGQTVPRLIAKDDPLWPLLRPRFDGDRVFVHDSIVLTVVGGSTHERSQEFAWRLYQHDLKGLQALADAVASSDCQSPFSLPVAVLVDYLGFRVVCRPKVVALGDPPAELVLGPLAEAEVAYGAPGDLPELWREASNAAAAAQKEEATNPTAYPGDSAESVWRQQLQLRSRNQFQFASLVLHEWDRRHPQLRSDLARIAEMLGLQGYPVCLMSDLPKTVASTALLRLRSHAASGVEADAEEAELHFRSPAELMPPEILPDTDPSISRIVDPVKRVRREALWSLSVPPLPPTHAVTAAANSGQAGGSHVLKELTFRAERELPQQLLDRISSEGPPLDSQGWTDILHASGVNIRHMSRVAALASTSSAAALHREALARSVKWLLRKRLWTKKPWAPVAPQRSEDVHMGPERVAAWEAVKIFNLSLGSGEAAVEFWDHELVPETTRRFGFESALLSRHRVKPHALFRAMEHHCRVKFTSAAHRAPLHAPGCPEPFHEEDLASFESAALQPHFPHLDAVKDAWQQRLQQYHAVDAETRRTRDQLVKEPRFRGFVPDVRIICARGEEWSAAVSAPTRHTREGRWDRVFQVFKLQLTFSRALGEAPAATGAILQGIAVALLEMAKNASKPVEDPDTVDEMAAEVMMKSGPTVDRTCLKKALWAADSATQMLPSPLSAWWAQLAAFEAEWLLEKHVEAHARLQRLQMEWDRLSPDQPVLMLRLEGTAARLYAQQGNWSAAALHTEKCCNLAERAFGRAHPASVALRARLGDAWSRREDWDKATAAFQEAYSVAQVASDQKTTGRLAFELAQVLYWKGDLSGAKSYAEDSVKLLVPIDMGSSRGGSEGPQLSSTSFEALMLLSQVYENLCRRVLELHDKEQAEIHPPVLQGLILKAVKCFETVLKNLPLPQQTPRRPGVLSRAAEIAESILGLKVMGMGDGEYTVLVDAVEELLLHASASTETAPALQRAIAQTRGVRQLQPRAETRAVAEAALRPVSSDSSRERPARLAALFESIAREALMSDVPPSIWFDQTVRLVAEGFSGSPEPGNVTYQATIQLLELCRYFGDAARVIMCACTAST